MSILLGEPAVILFYLKAHSINSTHCHILIISDSLTSICIIENQCLRNPTAQQIYILLESLTQQVEGVTLIRIPADCNIAAHKAIDPPARQKYYGPLPTTSSRFETICQQMYPKEEEVSMVLHTKQQTLNY